MFKTKKKLLALVLGASILALSLGFTGAADAATSTLSVQFKNLKIYFNGQLATLGAQPLIVNGSTYLPVRAMATLMNKTIDWNATTQSITIKDKPDGTVAALEAQIVLLKAQLAAKEEVDINDVEDNLNDDYSDFEDLEWEINLSGDEDDVVLTAEVDLGTSGDKSTYNDLSSSQLRSFLQKMVDDILDSDGFDDASVTGKIKDSDSGDTLATFKTNSSDYVTITIVNNLGDMEDQLNDDYADVGDLGDIEGILITLDGDVDDLVTFTVSVEYSTGTNDDEWDALSDTEIEDYMLAIQEALEDEFSSADVSGRIEDSDNSDARMASITTSGIFSRASSYLQK